MSKPRDVPHKENFRVNYKAPCPLDCLRSLTVKKIH